MPVLTDGDPGFSEDVDVHLGTKQYVVNYPWRNVLMSLFIAGMMAFGGYVSLDAINNGGYQNTYTYIALVIGPIGMLYMSYYSVVLAIRTFTKYHFFEHGILRVRVGFESRLYFKDLTAFNLVIEKTDRRMKIKADLKGPGERFKFKDEKDLDNKIARRIYQFGQFLVDRTPDHVKVTGSHGVWRQGADGPG